MISEIDDFIDFFQIHVRHPHFVTEFYLYSAYILHRHKTYSILYNKTQYYGCCNIADFDVPEFDQHFARMLTDTQILTVSIHRRSYPLITDDQYSKWSQFLLSKKINTISTWRPKCHSTLTLQSLIPADANFSLLGAPSNFESLNLTSPNFT